MVLLVTEVKAMKRKLLSILLTIVMATATFAQSEGISSLSNRNVERHLIELERQLSDALVRQDAVVLDHLWSRDLIFTFPDGKVSNKQQRLAAQKPATQPSESETVNDEVKVSLYGNTAVVTVLATWRGKANNQAYSNQFQATHVWTKQEGRWQLVAAHVSPVKK